MAVSCLCCTILVFILLSGKLSNAKSPECSNNTTESANLKVYNICCNPQNFTEPCENDCEILKVIATEVKEQMHCDVQINIIRTTRMPLNYNVSFSNLASLTINGETNPTTISCETSARASAGIVLSDVRSITLNNLELIGCGSVTRNIFKSKNNNFSSALTMIHCSDVKINRLTIAQSKGTGLTILNHQGGTVSIKSL